MDTITFIIIVAVLYAVLLFFDTFFKTCAHYPYIEFLRSTGLKLSFCYVNWETKFFNRVLVRWGSAFKRFFHVWYTLGLYVSLAVLPFTLVLLVVATSQIFLVKEDVKKIVSLEPVVPGLNLPSSELGFYIISMLICSLVHELGHALAAVNEDVHIEGIGFYIFFIIPVAYVNLNTDKLSKISLLRSLRIFCAGVWHNIVLAAVAWILYCNIPHFFSLFYYVNNGIIVTNVGDNSPLSGVKGLHDADIVTKVNDCIVKSVDDWNNCLVNMKGHKIGFCVESDFIRSLDESVSVYYDKFGILNCCDPKKSENLCFEYIEPADGVAEMPQHLCLPARKLAEKYDFYCNSDLHCPNTFHCVQPILSNSTFFFNFRRISKPNVVYLGHYYDVLQDVEVSSFIPRMFFESASFPMIVLKLLLYLVAFSLGLTVVNLIPCYCMDGQHIIKLIMYLIAPKHLDKNDVNVITFVIVLIGTFLFCFNCLMSMFTLL
ncbi:membrane-bound transcription factor site-2 protease [Agrilus planipennis]|uniref:Membrane-bound transcription factor site-2 protease n=1 Tax=Agrilus planipennis TaxID=224129 RepID=A0A1W4WTA3_AGRPL|nr:membrane-bound transcription factor site-2 protease [Agrilus planipennis]